MAAHGKHNLLDLEEQIKGLQIDLVDGVGELEAVTGKLSRIIYSSIQRCRSLTGDITAQDDARKHEEVVDPYVTVLIDGNVVRFKESLIGRNGKGGSDAAHLLHKAIAKHFSGFASIPKDVRIIVKIFADLKALSDAEVAAKNVYPNNVPLVLRPFAASFMADYPQFDFIDVGKRAVIETRLHSLLHQYLTDPQCVRIFFGGGDSAVQYLPMLRSDFSSRDKLVLVQTRPLKHGYESLGLDVAHFPDVFRSEMPPVKTEFHERPKMTDCRSSDRSASPSESVQHVDTESDTMQGALDASSAAWPHLAEDHTGHCIKPNNGDQATTTEILAPILPEHGPSGLIPVNALNERLDYFMRAPTREEWDEYNSILEIMEGKLCSLFALQGACKNQLCSYNRVVLESGAYQCLQWKVARTRCRHGVSCRLLNCIYGHTCRYPSKKDCIKKCSLRHTKDGNIAAWVAPRVDTTRNGEDNLMENGLETRPSSDILLIDL